MCDNISVKFKTLLVTDMEVVPSSQKYLMVSLIIHTRNEGCLILIQMLYCQPLRAIWQIKIGPLQ